MLATTCTVSIVAGCTSRPQGRTIVGCDVLRPSVLQDQTLSQSYSNRLNSRKMPVQAEAGASNLLLVGGDLCMSLLIL
jgi:hypothetical protein